MEWIDRRLRAGFQAICARRQHDVLQEHSIIEPAALLHHPVYGKKQADRRTEELDIAAVLGMHALLVGPADTEQAIQVPPNLAAPLDIWRLPSSWIVGIFCDIPGRGISLVE